MKAEILERNWVVEWFDERQCYHMVITDFLEQNARLYGSEVSLVELNPSEERDAAVTWRDFSLIESANPGTPYRREMTWRQFDKNANRFANLLLSRGVKRGTKVGILLMIPRDVTISRTNTSIFMRGIEALKIFLIKSHSVAPLPPLRLVCPSTSA